MRNNLPLGSHCRGRGHTVLQFHATSHGDAVHVATLRIRVCVCTPRSLTKGTCTWYLNALGSFLVRLLAAAHGNAMSGVVMRW
jgi:hypothetical protein